MREILRNVIFKYMGIMVEDANQNLLSLPVMQEYWPYVLIELEDVHHFPIIQAIDQISYDEFTLEGLSKRLTLISQ